MKFIFSSLISLCLLTTLLFGQSSDRPQSIVIPISSIGEVSETRKQILQNTLTQELSKHFQILPQDQFERVQEKVFEELEYEECTEDQCIIRIQEILQIENVINLQVIGEEGDTQLNLKWMNLDEKKNREDYCEGCKTKELRKRVVLLVEKMLGKKEFNTLKVQNIPNFYLYEKWVNGEKLWVKNGNPNVDGIYFGQVKNGVPNGNGTLTFPDGRRYEGEWKNNEMWNIKGFERDGKILDVWVNGQKQ